MTYVKRRITVSFSGGLDGQNLTFEDLRVHARIRGGGQINMGTAEVAIYGLTLSHISALSLYAQVIFMHASYTMTIIAGDVINGMNTVFKGTVTQAWADFQSAPDVPFHVVCKSGWIGQVQVNDQAWNSYSGTVPVSKMVKNCADQMGLPFRDYGVTATLTNPYHYGSPRDQIKKICEASSTAWNIGMADNTVNIWPNTGTKGSSGIIVAPPGRGGNVNLVSYPTFTDQGVLVKTEFAKVLDTGQTFSVVSDLQAATKNDWQINTLDYDLQARTPNGHWFLTIGGKSDNLPYLPK